MTVCDLGVYCALTGRAHAAFFSGGVLSFLPVRHRILQQGNNAWGRTPLGRGLPHPAGLPGVPRGTWQAQMPLYRGWAGARPRSSSMLLPHLVGQVPGTPRNCGSVSRCKTWWLLGRPGGQDWPTSEDNGRHAPWHIESAEKIKQSKRLARNQTIKIPQIPLSHPTGFQNQNNQNPGKIPVNGKHCVLTT